MFSSNAVDFASKSLAPSLEHLFGTDFMGRDMFLRTLDGLSISILTGLLTSVISVLIALILAILATNKRLSPIIESFTNLVLGIPHLILLILLSFACGKGAVGVIVAVSLTHWPTLYRIFKNEILQIKSQDYIQIAKMCGTSKMTIFVRHIIPNLAPQMIVGVTLAFPHAILHESTLTFLGLGFSPEVPAIGNILSESMSYLTIGDWWLALFPGLSLVLVVLIVNLLLKKVEAYAK